MQDPVIIFFLLFSAVLLVGMAQKIRVPYPVILILGGAAISFIPGIDNIYFNPNAVLMIFLPPVLYYSAFGISLREFQRNWKNIFSLALGLVALTTTVVGVIFKWLFPEFSWPLAFAFGAIVSPPDAVAVTAVLKRFKVNLRLITLLEGESLVNDASAIVIYKLALVALLTGVFSLGEGSLEFLYVAGGGVIVGAILGLFLQGFSRRYLEPVLGVIFSFTIPYVTYLLADMLEVSGVLAVVVTGLIGARIIHSHHSSLRRVLGYAVWDIFIILLNCLVFILIGLQVRTIALELDAYHIVIYSGYALLIAFAMALVRMAWVFSRAAILYIKALRHRGSSKLCSQILKEAAIIGWTGMRGMVSLAVALALPFTLPEGSPLPGRNEVVFITFVVILLTLVIPGLTLPLVIQWLRLSPANKDDNLKRVRNQLCKYSEEVIAAFIESGTINHEEYKCLKNYFHSQYWALELAHKREGRMSNVEIVRRKVIHLQRLKLMEIWEKQEIDDKLLNHLENELDMLETHIARAELEI